MIAGPTSVSNAILSSSPAVDCSRDVFIHIERKTDDETEKRSNDAEEQQKKKERGTKGRRQQMANGWTPLTRTIPFQREANDERFDRTSFFRRVLLLKRVRLMQAIPDLHQHDIIEVKYRVRQVQSVFFLSIISPSFLCRSS